MHMNNVNKLLMNIKLVKIAFYMIKFILDYCVTIVMMNNYYKNYLLKITYSM